MLADLALRQYPGARLLFHGRMQDNPGNPASTSDSADGYSGFGLGVAMRRRLKNFLPIVLIALAVQIFAPIAACWAAGIAASDPLSAAVICHGNSGPGGALDDQNGAQGAQRGCCVLCGMLHTAAPVDSPQTATLFTFERQVTSVVWHALTLEPATSRAGSPEQARAPPSLS
jgi:Protein of unknown function (DUF2946)